LARCPPLGGTPAGIGKKSFHKKVGVKVEARDHRDGLASRQKPPLKIFDTCGSIGNKLVSDLCGCGEKSAQQQVSDYVTPLNDSRPQYGSACSTQKRGYSTLPSVSKCLINNSTVAHRDIVQSRSIHPMLTSLHLAI
jgi:hypothetical protein